MLPLVERIDYEEPSILFASFSALSGSLFLDSAQIRSFCGRYSFIAIDPFITMTSKNGLVDLNGERFLGNPWIVLHHYLTQYRSFTIPHIPPFQGGAAGCFSYDLYHDLEHISSTAKDDMGFPDMMIGFYDLVLGFDLEKKEAWVISHGFPLKDHEQASRAKKRINWIKQILKNKADSTLRSSQKIKECDIISNFTANDYQKAVTRVIEYILSGDIFEANISQRFHANIPDSLTPFQLYTRLRTINPAPFAAFMKMNEVVIASASPERFLKCNQGQVETRPIKGTRPRGKSKEEDEYFAKELLCSEKDHSENVMIVDLLRNDLSRVCEDHTVTVPQLCGLESYATVHHLVSIVEGKLKPETHVLDLLAASYPGGSITGAPKIRALEIIDEIEPTKRGPYCGSMGYIGFNGDMDTSITIRTFCIKNNVVTFQAGGAIVMDSDPLSEYEETLFKSNALRKALVNDIAY